MFGSSNSNVKKLSALGAVLAIVLMSCGGSSSSSNANKSKNAVIDNGQCVLEADDVAARDASQADYDSASSTFDAAKSQAYDAYYQKVNELKDDARRQYGPEVDRYLREFYRLPPTINNLNFLPHMLPFYGPLENRYSQITSAYIALIIDVRLEFRRSMDSAQGPLQTAADSYNKAAQERETQYLADCGDLVTAGQAALDDAVMAASSKAENDIAALQGDDQDSYDQALAVLLKAKVDSYKSADDSYASDFQSISLTWKACRDSIDSTLDEPAIDDAQGICSDLFNASAAALTKTKTDAKTSADTSFNTAVSALPEVGAQERAINAVKEVAIKQARDAFDVIKANVRVPSEPRVVVPPPPPPPGCSPSCSPVEPPFPPVDPPTTPTDIPVMPEVVVVTTTTTIAPVSLDKVGVAATTAAPVSSDTTAASASSDTTAASASSDTTAAPVSSDNKVVAAVEESTEFVCDQFCIDNLQFQAMVSGQVTVQMTDDQGRIDEAKWISIETGSPFSLKGVAGAKVAIKVTPRDNSQPTVMVASGDAKGFTRVDSIETVDSSGSSRRGLVVLALVLLIVVFGLFRVVKQRKAA